jgi:hypothetical protein
MAPSRCQYASCGWSMIRGSYSRKLQHLGLVTGSEFNILHINLYFYFELVLLYLKFSVHAYLPLPLYTTKRSYAFNAATSGYCI